jgi:alpha-tubulin suppressor-like RCC1 family protein
LLSTSRVKCWGQGGLGNGSDVERLRPVFVSGITNATAIGAGSYHSCASLSTGNVKCWGSNDHGQVGDGTTIKRHRPVKVVGLS